MEQKDSSSGFKVQQKKLINKDERMESNESQEDHDNEENHDESDADRIRQCSDAEKLEESDEHLILIE